MKKPDGKESHGFLRRSEEAVRILHVMASPHNRAKTSQGCGVEPSLVSLTLYHIWRRPQQSACRKYCTAVSCARSLTPRLLHFSVLDLIHSLSALCEHHLLELVPHALLQELPVERNVVRRDRLHCLPTPTASQGRKKKKRAVQ